MKFVDLNKEEVKRVSRHENGFYVYILGSSVEVTSIKSKHCNSLMSSSLSSDVKEDKLMVRYTPANTIYFSEDFIESESCFASCYIDDSVGSVFIDTPTKFGGNTGILAFSGYLSLNNMVEEDRPILCTQKMLSTIMNRIRVLSLGVRGDKLYGLFYLPASKGIKLSIRGSSSTGLSTMTYKEGNSENYKAFTIKDWFDRAKIVEK